MSAPKRFAARWIVPAASPPVRDGAVLIDAAGRIAAVGPGDAVPSPDDAEIHDLGEAAILPGLVNAHAHPDLTPLRGAIEDLSFPDWIATLLRLRLAAALSDDDFIAAARMGCAEMLAAGITTVAATEDSIGSIVALTECGMRGLVYREVFGPDAAQAADSMAGLRAAVTDMRLRESDLVRVGISPHSPISVSDELFAAAARFAKDENLPVAVHAAESAAERSLVERGAGEFAKRLGARGIPTPPRGTTIELLDRTGILEREPLLVHCVTVNETDSRRIADAGATVAHCPAANARLGHGVAPVRMMAGMGITVALGSDSVASNNRVDMLEEARTAQMLQRASLESPDALPAAEALRMATLEGARALGLDHRCGDLRPGLDADLCVIRLDAAHVLPVHDPVSAIIHSARACDVRMTVVRGVILYRDGEHASLDIAAVRAAVETVAARIRAASAAATKAGVTAR